MDAQLREQEGKGAIAVKDIEAKCKEIEKRVGSLVTENRGLKRRVRDLEQELAKVQREVNDFQLFHGKRMHIKEKIEGILNALDTIKAKE